MAAITAVGLLTKCITIMKKILFMALFAVMALTANAQKGKITVWYGLNVADLSSDDHLSTSSELKPLNFGVDYTGAIKNNFYWTVGGSYQTKGCEDWDPGVIQVEGNISYNFVHNSPFKLGVFLGPYMHVVVSKDDDDLDRHYDGIKTFGAGVQTGLVANYKALQLKAGYEYGGVDILKNVDSKPYMFYFRIGYNF